MDRVKIGIIFISICISGLRAVQVRLIGDSSNGTGIIQLYTNGKWAFVNPQYIRQSDVQVICRTLGFENSGIAMKLDSGYGKPIFDYGPGSMISDYFSCVGNETSFSQCRQGRPPWFETGLDRQPSAISCEGTKLRLVDGDTQTSGRVEVFIKNSWHTICDRGFDNNDARVICAMLGHKDTGIAVAVSGSSFGVGTDDAVLTSLDCIGTEIDIKLCRGEWTPGCNHRSDAGVKCGATPIRLVNGPDPASGRVEIKHGGQWGTLCAGQNFDNRDVTVICRMLGYNSTRAFAHKSGFYGEGIGPIVAYNPVCDGTEDDIAKCSSIDWSVSSFCSHKDDVGVNCKGETKIRLVDGDTDQSGRVEIFHNGHWGTVRSQDFDKRDLMVVCRTLGFEYTENSFFTSRSYYGSGIGEVIVDSLGCDGTEEDIGLCDGSWWPLARANNHDNDLGVNCNGHIPIRLVGGPNNATGRVEVMHNGHYGTICSQDFDRKDLLVVCRMLGFPNIPSTAYWHSDAYFGQGLGEIVMSSLQCNGIESTIGKCGRTSPADTYSCDHSKDLSISCDGFREAVRITGGQNNYTGRVEVFHNGEWGRICGEDFDRTDAVVICRILGFKNPENAAVDKLSQFGKGNGTILLSRLHCNGLEDTLEQCNPDWFPSYCYNPDNAGVNCCPTCFPSQIIG